MNSMHVRYLHTNDAWKPAESPARGTPIADQFHPSMEEIRSSASAVESILRSCLRLIQPRSMPIRPDQNWQIRRHGYRVKDISLLRVPQSFDRLQLHERLSVLGAADGHETGTQ